MINCTVEAKGKLLCNGTIYILEEEPLNYMDMWFWIYLGIYACLVLVAGTPITTTINSGSIDHKFIFLEMYRSR